MCNAVGFCVRYTLRRTRSLPSADLFDLRHAKHILHPRPAPGSCPDHCSLLHSRKLTMGHARRWQQQLRGVYAAGCFCCATQCSAHPFQPHVFWSASLFCLCTHLNLSLTHLFTAPPSSYAHSLPLPRVLARKFSSLARSPCACSLRARSISADIVFQCLMLYDSA